MNRQHSKLTPNEIHEPKELHLLPQPSNCRDNLPEAMPVAIAEKLVMMPNIVLLRVEEWLGELLKKLWKPKGRARILKELATYHLQTDPRLV